MQVHFLIMDMTLHHMLEFNDSTAVNPCTCRRLRVAILQLIVFLFEHLLAAFGICILPYFLVPVDA